MKLLLNYVLLLSFSMLIISQKAISAPEPIPVKTDVKSDHLEKAFTESIKLPAKPINGVVTDEKGQALVGATVRVKGTNTGSYYR